MYDSRHFAAEQRDRRRAPKLEEAFDDKPPVRSVRSIAQRFEDKPVPSHSNSTSASAPVTPAKTKQSQTSKSKKQTYSEAELRAFLKGRASGDKNGIKKMFTKPRIPSKEAAHNATVGSLIQKWGGNALSTDDRQPLQERDLQRLDITGGLKKTIEDSVDTFGSTADFENATPKTDPGPRLQAFVPHLAQPDQTPPMSAAEAVVTGDQNLHDLVARGVQRLSAKSASAQVRQDTHKSYHAGNPPTSSPSGGPATKPHVNIAQHQVKRTPDAKRNQRPVDPSDSDWGAGDAYICKLFAEAEETAERAVHCDENEEYFGAFELYWVVVDLYYKVIPFLSPEQGEDVHERIKMYTRRCGLIREAFEDDPEGQDHLEDRIADANLISAQMEEQIQESFNTGTWNHSRIHEVNNVQQAQAVGQYPSSRTPIEESPTTVEDTASEKQYSRQKATSRYYAENDDLQRNRFPDYPNSQPLASIPDAPRNPQAAVLSASTKAHRNSLSRPISRSAVRASTSSVSRERVAEMQERVQVMQECLNNFTVKRKHLGPARALELHVTTLNANTFGDLKRLEPLAPGLEHKWATELEVLLSMLQEIKEVRPGVGYALRDDIAKHLPALERCDRIVRKTMRSFSALSAHVQYVERESGTGSAKGGRGRRRWWVKVPVVATGGLPSDVLRIVKDAEIEMRGVFKICHEINVEVVKSMPVPSSFVVVLPKHARSLIPRELKEGLTTWGMFKVSDYMKDRNLWNKDAAKEITSSLEKVALIWEAKTSGKNNIFARTFDLRGERAQQAVTAFRRCQNAIRDLRRDWPTMQHTELDMAKIQNNEDIGHAGLEAYSRALESRAYRLLTRIRELVEANEESESEGRTRDDNRAATMSDANNNQGSRIRVH